MKKDDEINKVQEPDKLDDIQSWYYKMKNDKQYSGKKYTLLHRHLYCAFEVKFENIFLCNTYKEIKEKMNNFSGKNHNIDTEKKKFDDIKNELKKIKDDVEKDYEYYNILLYRLEERYEENYYSINNIEEIYDKICNDIIESRIKTFIKTEKQLIALEDKLKEINSNLVF